MKRRPAGNRTASNHIADHDSPSVPPAVDRLTAPDARLDHFRSRLVQDALAEAAAAYWHKRAKDYERARSRPGDYVGEATPAQIAAADARLTALAAECRRKADQAADADDSELVDTVLRGDSR